MQRPKPSPQKADTISAGGGDSAATEGQKSAKRTPSGPVSHSGQQVLISPVDTVPLLVGQGSSFASPSLETERTEFAATLERVYTLGKVINKTQRVTEHAHVNLCCKNLPH